MSSNHRKQGDIGVAEAIAYYTRLGHVVSMPMTEASRYDLIVDDGDKLLRIQCKTSTYKAGLGYDVNIATSGGNRSWNGKRKPISKEECDIVFIWCDNDSLWEVPSDILDGKFSFRASVKNKKYLVKGALLMERDIKVTVPFSCASGCGSTVSRKGGRCRSCASKGQRKKIDWPSDEEIHKMLKTMSFVKVGKILGVSDNAVRKHLKHV